MSDSMCHRLRPAVATLLALSMVASPTLAQIVPVCPPTNGPGVDNRDGYLVLFEEQAVHPMEMSSNGTELWTLNVPDARVSVFDATNPTGPGGPALLAEIGVGLGPVTIRRRPAQPLGNPEMWVVCQSSNSVFVIDETTRRVTASIRVTHEPADLVFDPTGATAWVSVGATNQVVEINAATRQVANTIEFESVLPTVGGQRLHIEEPQSLWLEGNNLYGVSHLSGNGTTINTFGAAGINTLDPQITQLWTIFNGNPALPEPPDRDILRLDVTNPGAAGTVVGWRFGTLNFDLAREPAGPNLVVSNVDLKNGQNVLEPLVALSRFAEHRISSGPDATSALSNQTVSHFDLNDANNVHAALVTLGYSCAFPNEMTWNAAGDRLYVACYGTNNVAVLDWPPTTVLAELRSNASVTNQTGFGTHGVLLDEGRGVVYTYEDGDGTLQVYASNPATGTVSAPLRTVSLGFDITPRNIESGRFLFNDAKNSTFGTESCATCHYRGHLDGIAWNLGDLTGDVPTMPGQGLPPLNRLVARDFKNLKVTMSLRGIEETPPFHWRGDRADYVDFGAAQTGLLGGQPLTRAQLQDIDDFVFSLSYRPNPNQQFNRAYTPAALDGFSCFADVNTTPLSFDTDASATGSRITVSCNGCHEMAGFSGTNNQVNNDCVGLGCNTPGDATQLRGLWDKLSDQVAYAPGDPNLTVPTTGWGFANNGVFDTHFDFVQVAVVGNQTTVESRVTTFFDEIDTGTAPTTAYAWTADAVTINAVPNEVVTTILAADAGHNELIVRGWINQGAGPQSIGMFYLPNPTAPGTGLFFTDTGGIGPFNAGQLVGLIQAGNAVLTFIGTPVGMGYRLSLDREMDFLFDGNEAAVGASTLSADTDGDQFPDGYEIRLGTNPNSNTSFPALGSDTTPPGITNAAVAWRNSNVAKVRWWTNEESPSRVHVRDTAGNLLFTVAENVRKWQHEMVVRGLSPGQTVQFEIEAEDPANANIPFLPGNLGNLTLAATSLQPRLFPTTMHVQSTTLTPQGANPNGTINLQASFTLVDGNGVPMGAGRQVTFDAFEWVPGGTGAVTPVSLTATTNAAGVATLTYTTTTAFAGLGAIGEVIARTLLDPTSQHLPFAVESGQFGFWAQANLP